MLRLQDLLPSFRDEMEKIAKAKSLTSKVDAHHQAEKKDWQAFEKDMKSPRFVAEVKRHPDSDAKLKAYAEANNKFVRSKDVVAMIPSSSEGKLHTVKRLPNGSFGCSCKDWQYKHSWNNGECKHIQAAKSLNDKKG